MKTKLIILKVCLACLSLHAQTETAHFSIEDLKYSTLFSVKNLKMIERTEPFDPYYDFMNYEELVYMQNELFHRIFKDLLPDHKEILDDVTYRFYLDKELKAYGFYVSFPTENKPRMLEWEEQLFQFGNEFAKLDFSHFFRPYDKKLFQGSIYYVLFSHMKGMSEGKKYSPD